MPGTMGTHLRMDGMRVARPALVVLSCTLHDFQNGKSMPLTCPEYCPDVAQGQFGQNGVFIGTVFLTNSVGIPVIKGFVVGISS